MIKKDIPEKAKKVVKMGGRCRKNGGKSVSKRQRNEWEKMKADIKEKSLGKIDLSALRQRLQIKQREKIERLRLKMKIIKEKGEGMDLKEKR